MALISALPDGSQVIAKAFQAKRATSPICADRRRLRHLPGHGINPAHAPAFADWKSHVLDDYRDEQLPALLNQKTQELADKAKSENDLNKAAKEMGATVKTSDTGRRRAARFRTSAQVGPGCSAAVRASVGDISGPINAGRTGVVAKIARLRQEPTADDIKKNFDQTRDQILDQRRDEAFELFVEQRGERLQEEQAHPHERQGYEPRHR